MSLLSIPTAPDFTPWHSLVGGMMLASCVHHALVQLGTVVGISGFLHRAVKSLVSSGGESRDSQLLKGNANGTSKGNAKPSPNSIHHSISPDDDTTAQSDATNGVISTLFVNGLLAGGAVLAAARLPLEAALGVPIFDAADPGFHLGRGMSHGLLSWSAARQFLPTAFWGLLVGLGTKLGSGCTSGHFLCGLSRLSPRSFVATAVFFGVAVGVNLYAHPLTAPARILQNSTPVALPSIWALLLLQTPAILYSLVVPRIVASREKDCSAEEAKALHDQATRFTAAALGLHFACGLALTGMTRPSKVLGFLNLSPARIHARQWDPSLAMVALGGIFPSAWSWFTTVKPRMLKSRADRSDAQSKPFYRLSAPTWRVPTRTDVDWRLLVGAALFGVGWGVTGLCPGPALTTFGASTLPAGQDLDALVHLARQGTFVGAMGVGGLLGGLV